MANDELTPQLARKFVRPDQPAAARGSFQVVDTNEEVRAGEFDPDGNAGHILGICAVFDDFDALVGQPHRSHRGGASEMQPGHDLAVESAPDDARVEGKLGPVAAPIPAQGRIERGVVGLFAPLAPAGISRVELGQAVAVVVVARVVAVIVVPVIFARRDRPLERRQVARSLALFELLLPQAIEADPLSDGVRINRAARNGPPRLDDDRARSPGGRAPRGPRASPGRRRRAPSSAAGHRGARARLARGRRAGHVRRTPGNADAAVSRRRRPARRRRPLRRVSRRSAGPAGARCGSSGTRRRSRG